MPFAVVADIHANLEALDAVLRDVDAHAPSAQLLVAGDVVGYGPDPERCLERLAERDARVVRGNHEEMVVGLRDDGRCVAAGILAVDWTRRRLDRHAVHSLRRWPAVLEVTPEIVMCHGDLDDAGTYVSDADRAGSALARLREAFPRARVLICGHTHVPMCFSREAGFQSPIESEARRLDEQGPWLLNPGAVGQARDEIVRARWALVEDGASAVTFRSVRYAHEETVCKLRAAGLTPSVSLRPPRGVRRHIERGKAAAARSWVRVRRLMSGTHRLEDVE
jgi:predicted phosphodiesterase